MRRRPLLAVIALAAAGVVAPVLPVEAQPVPVTPTTVSLPVPQVSSATTTGGSRSAPGGRSVVAQLTRTGVDFDVAGVTFSGAAPAGLQIEARTHSAQGWSAWKALETTADSGPDTGSSEASRAVPGSEDRKSVV